MKGMPTGVYKHIPRGRLDTPRRVPIRVIGPSIAYLPLTQGFFAVIDAEDIERVSEYSWHVTSTAHYSPRYARAAKWIAPGKVDNFTLHRFLLGFPEQVDHKNGDGLHNWKGNLRKVTTIQNQQNAKRSSNNTSGFKGVCWHPQGWQARISINGKRTHLGFYATPAEAGAAIKRKRKEIHGEFARH